MNNNQLNQIKREKPVIHYISMREDYNYVDYSDSDSMTDYFNGYSLSLKQTIEWLKEDAGKVIRVVTGQNNDEDETRRYEKRINRIVKAINYKVIKVDRFGFWRGGEYKPEECLYKAQLGESNQGNGYACSMKMWKEIKYFLYDPLLVKEEEIKE